MKKESLKKDTEKSSKCEKVEKCKEEKCEAKEQCCKICKDNSLKFKKRVQFTVEAKSKKICALLKCLDYFGINISAATLLSGKDDQNIFKFIVGQDKAQSKSDLLTTKYILKSECLCYSEDEVLKVKVKKSVTSTLAEVYCLLIKKIEVLALYTAEDGDIILEVDNLKYANKAMKNL